MDFRASLHLQKATGRAKSDVANKLVSMLLHEISRRVIERVGGPAVTDPDYTEQVESWFGSRCLYCAHSLENDRAVVEHLDGMNRFRLGLHVPGNVAVSCIWCNREKRRDDQCAKLVLADSGWESFLSHDTKRCTSDCKTCGYWAKRFPQQAERWSHLQEARRKILTFRTHFAPTIIESDRIRCLMSDSVEGLYRDCQRFATDRIAGLCEAIFSKL